MNSKVFLNLEEYLEMLEKKRDIELPQQLLEIDQEMKKLKERKADLLKTIRDTSLEIDNLKCGPRFNKSLMDIPPLVWRLIQQCCIREQNSGILDVCLASTELDEIIKGDSVANTLRVTGEKVFRVLLETRYLDKNDVENCLNSNSRDLERFAGSTWVYGNRGEWGKEQTFRTSEEITDFAKIVNESKQKWKLFAFQKFTFSTELQVPVPGANYEEFWEAALTFIKTFGNFLLCVALADEFVRDGTKSIYKNLLQQLPRIERFHADVQAIDNYQLYSYFTINSLSDRGGNYSLDFCHNANFACPFLEQIGPQCRTWSFERESLAQVSPEHLSPNICLNVKVLEFETYNWDRNDGDFQQFMDADLSNFANVISLNLKGGSSHITKSFALLEKFPRVKTIQLLGSSGGTPMEDRIPPAFARFPTVTKLTLNIDSGYLLLPLDRIPQLLPSLTKLTIKCSFYDKTVFAAQLLKAVTEDGDFQQQNKIIDVYQIYGEGRSILESSIWQHMPNLARIIVETVAQYRERNYYGRLDTERKDVRTEIFVRPMY